MTKHLRILLIGLCCFGFSAHAQAFTSQHTFTVNDVMGGFDGSTFGTSGTLQDPDIICDIEGGAACPADGPQPFTDKEGVTLYPVDSEFGYYPVDFLGAVQKTRDNLYTEGFVGNITGVTETGGVGVVGIKIANAETDTYKVRPPMGTWCRGLGGNAVKCETEHYSVMEHLLSCHEVIPYFYATETGVQKILELPDGRDYDCAEAGLDDNVLLIASGELTSTRLTSATPLPGVGGQMFPNDKTDMENNIALSADYSIQLKDDGKPLYGWGTIHKRPNDIRLYARLALPATWKERDASGNLVNDFPVASAQLVITHWITNNPNDQIRPEDLENEAATGRKPSYRIDENNNWRSLDDCYEGDGDLILQDTLFKNLSFALPAEGTPGILESDPPYAFSSDLKEGMTNAWYTTLNRDPFEWSYDSDPDPNVQAFVGSPVPDDSLGSYVSGPRWRLKPNKFGQDLPGLEIPLQECSPPPFTNDNLKYEVGQPTTTVINLLDWDAAKSPSPLSSSKGWVDAAFNSFVELLDGTSVTTNGLPMTDDFDLAIYVKGDSKPTAIFTATLIIDEGGDPPLGEASVEILEFKVPSKVQTASERKIILTIYNDPNAQANADGHIVISNNLGFRFVENYSGLEPGEQIRFDYDWQAPIEPSSIEWNAEVYVDDTRVDMQTGVTLVR